MSKWTRQDAAVEAGKFDTRRAFQDGSNRAYQAAKYHGWLDEICSHMDPVRTVWTYDRISEAARKYTTRTKFARGDYSAYQAAVSRGIIDIVCSHMILAHVAWTNELIQEEAAQYQTRKSFQIGSPNAYAAARRISILDEVCSHMVSGKGSDEDVVYVWRDATIGSIVKIGITSERLDRLRITECARAASLSPDIIVYQAGLSSAQSRDLESQLLKIGDVVDMPKFYGHTEFRSWTDTDLNAALSLVSEFLRHLPSYQQSRSD